MELHVSGGGRVREGDPSIGSGSGVNVTDSGSAADRLPLTSADGRCRRAGLERALGIEPNWGARRESCGVRGLLAVVSRRR